MRVLIQRWPCGCGSSSGIRALGIRLRLFGNLGSRGCQNITIQALATGSARTSICQGRASVISIMFRGLSTLARLTPAALAPAVVLCDEKSARGALADLIDKSEARRGDGTSLGPTMVRLAWHSAGTFCARTGTGGSDGGRMKYCPESAWGANAGLADVRKVVEKVRTPCGNQPASMAFGIGCHAGRSGPRPLARGRLHARRRRGRRAHGRPGSAVGRGPVGRGGRLDEPS